MDQMTAAIAASGVFIKMIESHFQLSNELVKVKNAMKMLRLVERVDPLSSPTDNLSTPSLLSLLFTPPLPN